MEQKDGKAVAQKVRITRKDTYESQAWISEGLSADQEIIDEGFRDVIDGSLVKVQQEKDQAIAKNTN
ncbi:MAG: hypothetical protein HC880_08030 [Bacteroidia bacterium]|nr:hypothetical protein [Bacteroidia bacterium]